MLVVSSSIQFFDIFSKSLTELLFQPLSKFTPYLSLYLDSLYNRTSFLSLSYNNSLSKSQVYISFLKLIVVGLLVLFLFVSILLGDSFVLSKSSRLVSWDFISHSVNPVSPLNHLTFSSQQSFFQLYLIFKQLISLI